MDNIIQYLKNNTRYLIVFGAILLVSIVVIIAINIIVKKRFAKQKPAKSDKKNEKSNTEAELKQPVLHQGSILDELKQKESSKQKEASTQQQNEENAAEISGETPAENEDNSTETEEVKIEDEQPAEKELSETSAENISEAFIIDDDLSQNAAAEEPSVNAENSVENSDENEISYEQKSEEIKPIKTEKKANPAVKNNNRQAKENKETAAEKSQTEEPEQAAPATKEEKVKYAGKWIITEENGRFTATLHASNGELMLAGESYSSLSGCKSGIETLKKNIENDNYAINVDKNGNFVFKIFSTANRLLCVGEGYGTREQCEKAFASVKRFAKTATITVAHTA